MSHIKYRPEIDGLRTLAVLSVIIYHAELFIGDTYLLPGGFFGVDIFFVISGFLITSLILKELIGTGGFSFFNFYDRRIRRLIPVLLVVIVCSFALAWSLFLPSNFIDFSKSVVASIFFISNIYWFDSLQVYGAEASNLKPLLHTWSLAVEEQYYLLFPVMMLFGFKWFKKHLITVFTIFTLLSLQFAEYASVNDPSFSFYIIFSRFWELLMGSLLAYTLHFHPKKENDQLLMKIMPAIGLYLITYSIIFLSYESSKHPGFITLLPVMGTILIIWFSDKDEVVTQFLSSKLLVSIGLISYSLYLWHFPVFSFLRIEGQFSSAGSKIWAIIFVIVLSIASYRLIEQPFRSKRKISTIKFYSLVSSISLSIVCLSYLVIINDGYPDRFQGSIAASFNEMKEYRRKYWNESSAYTNINDFSANKTSIEVIGNSWAQDIANSLMESSDFEVGFRGMTSYRCKAITLNRLTSKDKEYEKQEKICTNNIKRFDTKLPNTNLVIIADNKHLLRVEDQIITQAAFNNIKHLRESGYLGAVLIISNRPTYTKTVFSIFKEYGSAGDGINQYSNRYLKTSINKLQKEDINAKKFYAENNVYYYSPVDLFCKNGNCVISDNGSPLYHDESHLTLTGAKYMGGHLAQFIDANILKAKNLAPVNISNHKPLDSKNNNEDFDENGVDVNFVINKDHISFKLKLDPNFWDKENTIAAFYLMKSGEKIKVRWYEKSISFDIKRVEIPKGMYSITYFLTAADNLNGDKHGVKKVIGVSKTYHIPEK